MFELTETIGPIRHGRFTTPHGIVETPCFMPIATKGAVKTLSSLDLEALGAQMILSNTYHLLLRPGLEGMRRLGGLHRLMHWKGPILTDSGGYQVFSLAKMNQMTDDGVAFQSHIDGARLFLTPELSMEMQSVIGSDVMMQFDDVAAADASRERCEEAMERSLRWAKRCKEWSERQRRPHSVLPPRAGHGSDGSDYGLSGQAGESRFTPSPMPDPKAVVLGGPPAGALPLLFGIVQGGTHEGLRQRSLAGLLEIGFDGYAIGGLSVGEAREDAYRIAAMVCERLPADRPRYFMGGGMPEEIVHYVENGVDMFDCVLPTRNARHGTLYVWKQPPEAWNPLRGSGTDFYEQVHIENEAFAFADEPLDPHCDCPACATTSRAYLRLLFQTHELLALRLATLHNVRFYLRLMERIRAVR